MFRHFVRSKLIPQLASVPDTQAGFKLFSAETARRAVASLASFTETFDVELLIHAGASRIEAVPILFTEDFAASNFPSVEPQQRHLDMIHQIIDIQRRLIPDDELSDLGLDLRGMCESMSLEDYVALIDRLGSRGGDGTSKPELFDTAWNRETLQL